MIRISFFAAGLFVGLWGISFLFVDKLVLSDSGEKLVRGKSVRGMLSNQQVEKDVRRVLDPPDWAAFSLMSVGAVTMLYSIALPRRHFHD